MRLDQAAGVLFEPIVPVVPAAPIQARLDVRRTAADGGGFFHRHRRAGRPGLRRSGAGRAGRPPAGSAVRAGGRVGAGACVSAPRGRRAMQAISAACWMNGWSGSIPGLGVEAMHLIVAARRPAGLRADRLGSGGGTVARPGAAGRSAGQPAGRNRVYRVAPVESDVPERSVRRVPALTRVDRRLAGRSAAAGAAARSAAADRGDGAAARPSAGRLHLAAGAPPGAPCRRAGTHRRRVVEARPGMVSVRDYFRVEDEDGPSLLAVPKRQWQRCRHRRHALVPTRIFLTLRSGAVWRSDRAGDGFLLKTANSRVKHDPERDTAIPGDDTASLRLRCLSPLTFQPRILA